jgi:hypothetical protein
VFAAEVGRAPSGYSGAIRFFDPLPHHGSRPIAPPSFSTRPAAPPPDLIIRSASEHPYFQGVAFDFSLSNPYVVVGLLFGGLLPYLFGALGMTAIARSAGVIVEEVRRQFRVTTSPITARPSIF